MTGLDFSILYFIQGTVKNPLFDFLMPFFSFIGDGGGIWILACVVMMFFRRTRIWAATGLIAMLIAFVAGEIIMKNIFCRIRPCYIDMTVQMLIPKPESYSFPSGHTASSFACASAFFVYNRRFGVAALMLAVLISFSRLYNFVHFPSDIAAGCLLGILSATLAVLVLKGVKNGKLKNRKSARLD